MSPCVLSRPSTKIWRGPADLQAAANARAHQQSNGDPGKPQYATDNGPGAGDRREVGHMLLGHLLLYAL